MAEAIQLTTPITRPAADLTTYTIRGLWLDWGHLSIVIHLRGTNGEPKEVRYDGAVAETMMRNLNTANLSTRSLKARIMDRLVQDDNIIGTVTGSPD